MIFALIHQFGKRHKIVRAFLNPLWQPLKCFLWSMRVKLLSGRPIKCKAGKLSFFMVNEGQIAKYMWMGGFEDEERDFAAKGIKSGMRVLNIGANAGLYCIIASKLATMSGEVHAFEPSSQNFELLKRNIEINECKNVILNKVALADFSGKLALNRDESHPDLDGHFFVRHLSDPASSSLNVIEEIPCISLDEYWFNACGGEIKPIDFIVIDVEGAELSIFNGAKKTIAASPNLVMIMECTNNLDEINRFLSDLSFSYYEWDVGADKLIPTKFKKGSLIAQREAR